MSDTETVTVVEYIKRTIWEKGDSLQTVVEDTLHNLGGLPLVFHTFSVVFDEEEDQWVAGWLSYPMRTWDQLFAAAEASKLQYDAGVASLIEGVEELLHGDSE